MKLGNFPFHRGHVIVAAAAASNHRSDDTSDNATIKKKLDLIDSSMGAYQAVWSGLTAASAISAAVKVQVSVDGVNWDDKSSTSMTISSAAGNKVVPIDNIHEQFVRVVYTVSDVTAGVIDVWLMAKSR